MSHEDVVKKMIDAVLNKHHAEAAVQFFHPHAVIHSSRREVVGIENVKNEFTKLFIGFPDIEFRIQDFFSTDGRVVVRWIAKGTHKGIFSGNAPTFKRIQYEGVSIFVVEENKIKEHWYFADLHGLLKQLGLLQIKA